MFRYRNTTSDAKSVVISIRRGINKGRKAMSDFGEEVKFMIEVDVGKVMFGLIVFNLSLMR